MTTTSELDDTAALGEDDVSAFQRDGHLLVRGLASRNEMAAWYPVIHAAAMRQSTEPRPLEERETYGRAFLQVMNLWQSEPEVRPFVLSPRFATVAARLLGVERVRLDHDQALFKEAGGGHTPWRQDQYYWPLTDPRILTMWIPLVDVPAEVGSMLFASGSHAFGHLDTGIDDESDERVRSLVAERGLSLTSYGAMAAGDATFHSGWTLHRAAPNPTPATRAVMTVIWYADGARVAEPANGYQRSDLQTWLPGAEVGELAATQLNPLLP